MLELSADMEGATKEDKVNSLWRSLHQWYKHNQVASKFGNLTLEMLQKGATPPPKKKKN